MEPFTLVCSYRLINVALSDGGQRQNSCLRINGAVFPQACLATTPFTLLNPQTLPARAAKAFSHMANHPRACLQLTCRAYQAKILLRSDMLTSVAANRPQEKTS